MWGKKKYFSVMIPALSFSAAEGFIRRGGAGFLVCGWQVGCWCGLTKKAKVCSTTSAVQAEYLPKRSMIDRKLRQKDKESRPKERVSSRPLMACLIWRMVMVEKASKMSCHKAQR